MNKVEKNKIDLAFQKHLQSHTSSKIAIISFLASLAIALSIAYLTRNLVFSAKNIAIIVTVTAIFLIPLLFWFMSSKDKMDGAFYKLKD